jgi:hypothetical protein
MKTTVRVSPLVHFGLLLCCGVLPIIVLAGVKEYSIKGTVTTLGTNEEIGAINSFHRTYTVKTPSRVFVLECPYAMDGIHIHSPKECGGKKKIEIGDAISFRIEKDYAHVLTDNGKDQKLKILSESMNENGTPEATKKP